MTKIICFDLRCLQMGHESRGIGMHARSILENLDPKRDIKYIIYAFDAYDPIKKLGIQIPLEYELVQTKTLKKSISNPQDFFQLSQIIWHRYNKLQQKNIDVFVQFDFMLGLPKLAGTTTILMAYDLIPLLFKDDYLPSPLYAFTTTSGIVSKIKKTLRATYYRWRYHLHYQNFSRADTILSISTDTTKSLHTILSVQLEKIVTIPLAPVFNTTKAIRPKGLIVEKDKFIFYIGATDKRKRVIDLIDAFNILRKKGIDLELVLAGKEFDDPQKIPQADIVQALSNTPYQKYIHTLGYVDDGEKLWLYKNSLAFIFPTLYEGFGLPVLEAMQAGCPVISYNNSSIPEVAGDAALLVETGNKDEIIKSVEYLYNDHDARSNLIKKGFEREKLFSWSIYMNKFYEVVI